MNEKRKPYPFDQIEPKWQGIWQEEKTFRTPNPGDPDFDPARPKFYVLDMFPYPSGAGLHVGHPEGYTATDIIARYRRMKGFNVLHPMGWDAFGLPAEQHAIKTGEHPRENTAQNIANFKRQLQRIGFNYDWDREVNTTDPGYFRWTQWIFRLLYESWFNPATNKAESIATYTGGDPDSVRLAFVSEAPVNWCPALGTVLANEEVIDGKSDVGGFPVERRPMRQWMLRITAYAERLIKELDGLDWPESIKLLQRNWIGRSEGAHVHFVLENFENRPTSLVALALDTDQADHPARDAVPEGHRVHRTADLTVFTTRPDTLFGATYMVLSPEHPLVDLFTAPAHAAAVASYRAEIGGKSDLERTELAKDKTGVFIGAYAVNPVNGERIPVWIADYVLMGYGTGAIMAVPAHDERDWEFAKKYDLPVRPVVQVGGTEAGADVCTPGEGTAIHSHNALVSLDGLPTAEAKSRIIDWLEANGGGQRTVITSCATGCSRASVTGANRFPSSGPTAGTRACPKVNCLCCRPTWPTSSPPAPASRPWPRRLTGYSTPKPPGAKRTPCRNGRDPAGTTCASATRATRSGSSARRPSNTGWTASSPAAWTCTSAARNTPSCTCSTRGFWHKVLFDHGFVSTPEPFQRLVNQGLILGEDGQKMSKSRGNVVNPDEVITEYGADALRLYEMFMGPLEQTKPWSHGGRAGRGAVPSARLAAGHGGGPGRPAGSPAPPCARSSRRPRRTRSSTPRSRRSRRTSRR